MGINQMGHYIKPINSEKLESFTIIKDTHGGPIAMFRIVSSRTIYLTGLKTIQYFFTVFIILGLAFSAMMVCLLHNLIVERLERLEKTISFINMSQSFKKRVHINGSD